MKVKRIEFDNLRNNEHFQCQIEFKNLVEEYGAIGLKIETLFEGSYLPLYDQEDEAILKIKKSLFTESRMEVDQQRDSIYRGIIYMNKAALRHFDPEVVASAKRLKILFDTYGNIPQMPLQEESSAIYNLLQDLNGDFNEDMQRVGLEDWKNKLQQENDAYQALVKQRHEEEVAKTELTAKEVRREIDKVFHQLIQRLEALMLIDGESNYIGFVSRLNVLLESYGNILAQRQGINAAKEEEGDISG